VLPNPGTPFQLVHTEDVATALAAAVRGDGPPGVYNLAGDGTIDAGDLARAFGWLSVPVPRVGVSLTAEAVDIRPFLPPSASWINALRVAVVMDTAHARTALHWEPMYDTRAVLEDTVASARNAGLL
jgi:UDP-glucose 4-epimerase